MLGQTRWALTLHLDSLSGLNAALVGADTVLLGGSCLDLEGHRGGVGVLDQKRTLDDLSEGTCDRQYSSVLQLGRE